MPPVAADVEALYREVVLEHYRSPHHRTPLASPDATRLVHNPVCGDQVRVEVRVAGGSIVEVAAITRGCSIAVAAGSVMTDCVLGADPEAVAGLHRDLGALVAGEPVDHDVEDALRAFARVSELPSRRRCALLAWEALEGALADLTAGDSLKARRREA